MPTIKEKLDSLITGDYAFMGDMMTSTIYYAQPRELGLVIWPAEVVLLQGMISRGMVIFKQPITVLAKDGVSIMGGGIIRHLGAVITPPPPYSNADAFKFVDLTYEKGVFGNEQWGVALDVGAPQGVDVYSQGSHLHRLYMMAALRLIFKYTPKFINISRNNAIARTDGHNIGALLVTRQGEVVALGLNAGRAHKTHHAEWNALCAYAKTGKKLPSNAIVYTSLKPCDMCAAMITQLLPDSAIIYAQDDPKATSHVWPINRAWALDSITTAKQVRLHSPELEKKGEYFMPALKGATATMQHGQAKGAPYFYLTNVVDSQVSFELMESAQLGLERKARKYEKGDYYGLPVKHKRPEVNEVLRHLAKVVAFTVKEPEIDWGRLREDKLVTD